MLTRLLLLALLVLPLPAAAGQRAFDNARLLHAIVVVEGWQGGVGPHGEIGPFQMMPATRAERLREFAARGETSPSERQLAAAHLEWLRRQMKRRGVAPLPFNFALAWNAGFEASVTGRAPVTSYDYARRLVAIMEAAR